MAATADDDSQQRFALGFLFILIGLLLSVVVGVAVYKFGMGGAGTGDTPEGGQATVVNPAAPGGTAGGAGAAAGATGPTAVSVVTETVTVVVPDGASIQVTGGVVNFYFATGSADIAPGAAEALALVIQGVQAGRNALVSGFHDTTGDRSLNEALARRRAETVRSVLLGLGVPADKARLEKPAETTGTGNDAQARRVEVKLVD